MVLGTALFLASFALVILSRQTMEGNVTSAARLRASDLVEAIESGRPLEPFADTDDDTLIQVVDEGGDILISSPSLQGDPVLARLQPGDSTIVPHPPIDDDDPFTVVAEEARTPDSTVTVLVGRNLDLVREATATTTRTLFVGVPLLLSVVALTTWVVTGRSLAPVEDMRSEVAGITQADLHRRLPLPQGKDEVARLAHTMNGMLERLEEGRNREQRLVSDASHELRNPIAAIRHLTEVAIAHPDRTSLEILAAEVLSEDLRLQDLAEGLLLLARADEHALKMSAVPVDLDDLVLDEVRRLKQGTSLRIESGEVRGARTMGDPRYLQRVVENLAANAAQHAASAVVFSLSEDGSTVLLQIDDDGPGIPLHSREAIFERFTRLDEARGRQQGGAGLGLAIVAEIVGAHGGRVAATQSPLGGARFEVVLPREP
jgi:signal transduction histidine kinase